MIEVNELDLVKKIPEISKLDLRIEPGECFVLLSSGEAALDHVINIFSGLEQEYRGVVRLDEQDIRTFKKNTGEYLVNLTAVDFDLWPPDMKIGSMISFFREQLAIPAEEFEELAINLNLEALEKKQTGNLEEVERRRLLFCLASLKKSKNYLFRDFVKGMPLEFNLEFVKNIRRLKEAGCSILYLGSDVFFAPEIGDRIGFMKKGKLLLEMKAARLRKMNLQELYFQFLS